MARYVKTQWNTTTVFNPTNMNHIEQGIYDADLREGGTIEGDLYINAKDGTSSALGESELILGNSTAQGTAQNSQGVIRLYSNTSYRAVLTAPNLTASRVITFPDKAGTIALNIGVVSGTTASSASWSSYYDLPSGFTASNSVVVGIQYEQSSGVWRSGDGATGNEYRFVVEMSGTAFRVFQNDTSAFSKAFKITFHRYA